MNRYYTVKEIMEALKVSRASAYGHIKSGRLKTVRIGRLLRIKAEDLETFIDGQPSKNKSR
ncbi:MAG TPA: helix-turn-helix domain-containing protein [Candidatus Aminicenantes bacterium]|nr:helix-turn-helix domain-containing protein [Candidatus Aminicenantes bacterium]HNT33131.1 helix-turn-helix domain-containing protein [Candidatus Aminicenantes bacterium]